MTRLHEFTDKTLALPKLKALVMAVRKLWTREELIVAFNLYCKVPYGSLHNRNPRIRELALLLGRSTDALAWKLNNFASLDPEHQKRGVKGAVHGAKADAAVWNEFYSDPEHLAYESERLLANLMGHDIDETVETPVDPLPREGLERDRMVRTRVNQSFFRACVLAAYDNRCCVTGLAVPELLVASHIVPWSVDAKQRMNPQNGLCLNALHDRAFDRGLMFVDEDMTVRFNKDALRGVAMSSDGAQVASLSWLTCCEGKPIRLPNRFYPDRALLQRHRKLCS